MQRLAVCVLCAAALIAARPAHAWDSHGHALVTYLALESASGELPEWLAGDTGARRAAFQASEADRFRGTRMLYLSHENNPEHYIDLDLLEQFGLTTRTLPRLRGDYLRTMILAKHTNPDRISTYDPANDPAGTSEWPGFLPHAAMEHYTKLRSAFNTVRILETLNDPTRAEHLEQARANAIYHLGMMSHFIGDAAQPLHTTVHHHGWVGDNPDGFTTDRRIHARIDGGVLEHHDINFTSLRGRVGSPRAVNSADPWNDTIAHIARSFREVRPLYELEKSGELDRDRGKAFIEDRLLDAGRTLAGFIVAAWGHAEPTPEDVASFLRYTGTLAPDASAGRPRGD